MHVKTVTLHEEQNLPAEWDIECEINFQVSVEKMRQMARVQIEAQKEQYLDPEVSEPVKYIAALVAPGKNENSLETKTCAT